MKQKRQKLNVQKSKRLNLKHKHLKFTNSYIALNRGSKLYFDYHKSCYDPQHQWI